MCVAHYKTRAIRDPMKVVSGEVGSPLVRTRVGVFVLHRWKEVESRDSKKSTLDRGGGSSVIGA